MAVFQVAVAIRVVGLLHFPRRRVKLGARPRMRQRARNTIRLRLALCGAAS